MTNKINVTFPTLKQLAAYKITEGNCEHPDPVLRCTKEAWDSLKEKGSQIFGPNHIMQNIEKALIEDFCKKQKVLVADLSPDDKERLLIGCVQKLFRRLAKELGVPIGSHPWPTAQKKWEEEAFLSLWSVSICRQLEEIEPQLSDIGEIKLWMEIPENAVHLNRITNVILQTCRMQAIPLAIKNLVSLADLDMRGNNIKYIPEFICTLPNLEILDLGSNEISCIPNAIGSCKNLTHLFLDDNKITHIPDAVAELTKLKMLELSSNKISCIPSSLSSLKKLHWIKLNANPLSLHLQDPQEQRLSFISRHEVESFLAKEKALQEYKCIGYLSQFIQLTQYAFSIDRHDIIKKAYHEHLSDQDKDLICMALFGTTGGEKYSNELWKDNKFLFENMEAFCDAAITAITLKYGLLFPDHRSLIREELSVRGQNSLYDNVLFWSDIMGELGL